MMKANTLMTIQLISLLLLIGSANSFGDEIFASLIFCSSFLSFACCSSYINRHKRRLLRELDYRHRKSVA